MSIVITLHDDLAKRLKSEAASRSLSIEDFAITVLDDAVGGTHSDEQWGRFNRRRLELIRKSTWSELDDDEQSELDDLQCQLDQRYEAFDAGLLTQLTKMKQSVEQLSAEQSHE